MKRHAFPAKTENTHKALQGMRFHCWAVGRVLFLGSPCRGSRFCTSRGRFCTTLPLRGAGDSNTRRFLYCKFIFAVFKFAVQKDLRNIPRRGFTTDIQFFEHLSKFIGSRKASLEISVTCTRNRSESPAPGAIKTVMDKHSKYNRSRQERRNQT